VAFRQTRLTSPFDELPPQRSKLNDMGFLQTLRDRLAARRERHREHLLDRELRREQAEAGAPHHSQYDTTSSGVAMDLLGSSVVEGPTEGIDHPLPAQDEDPPSKG
jgi:hypothetical protein